MIWERRASGSYYAQNERHRLVCGRAISPANAWTWIAYDREDRTTSGRCSTLREAKAAAEKAAAFLLAVETMEDKNGGG